MLFWSTWGEFWEKIFSLISISCCIPTVKHRQPGERQLTKHTFNHRLRTNQWNHLWDDCFWMHPCILSTLSGISKIDVDKLFCSYQMLSHIFNLMFYNREEPRGKCSCCCSAHQRQDCGSFSCFYPVWLSAGGETGACVGVGSSVPVFGGHNTWQLCHWSVSVNEIRWMWSSSIDRCHLQRRNTDSVVSGWLLLLPDHLRTNRNICLSQSSSIKLYVL